MSLLFRGEQEIAAGIGYDLDEVLADVDGIPEGAFLNSQTSNTEKLS